MTDESYNGWTNRESWLVALWLDNDEYTQGACAEIAKSHASDMAAGEAIRDLIENDDLFGELPVTGFLADLISGALARVDWREVGNHFRSE